MSLDDVLNVTNQFDTFNNLKDTEHVAPIQACTVYYSLSVMNQHYYSKIGAVT